MNGEFLAPLIPIVAIIAFTVVRLAKIRSQGMLAGPDAHTMQRLDAIEQELDGVRQELAEAQERIDFTERLLTQQKQERVEAPRDLA